MDGNPPDQKQDTNTLSQVWIFFREIASSAAIVVAIGLVLFLITGLWPPMVAVESGSMQPHMSKGDLVLVTEPGRYAPESAPGELGIVTYRKGSSTGYRSFGQPGSVIVYAPPSRSGPPIIHRVRFRIEKGENWYKKANKSYIEAKSCKELQYCPAPYSGYITKGDNNGLYDQALGISPPVKKSWVRGVARLRIPYLGCIRLHVSGNSCL